MWELDDAGVCGVAGTTSTVVRLFCGGGGAALPNSAPRPDVVDVGGGGACGVELVGAAFGVATALPVGGAADSDIECLCLLRDGVTKKHSLDGRATLACLHTYVAKLHGVLTTAGSGSSDAA